MGFFTVTVTLAMPVRKSWHILAPSLSCGKILTWKAFLIWQGGVSATQCFSTEDMNGHPVSSAWPNTSSCLTLWLWNQSIFISNQFRWRVLNSWFFFLQFRILSDFKHLSTFVVVLMKLGFFQQCFVLKVTRLFSIRFKKLVPFHCLVTVCNVLSRF